MPHKALVRVHSYDHITGDFGPRSIKGEREIYASKIKQTALSRDRRHAERTNRR